MNQTILIVDDIVINRFLLIELIKKLGYQYKQASNGKEAIKVINNESIDMVLMDIEMPIMNGIETTQYIRKTLKKTPSTLPIVALTAHNPKDLFETFKDVSFNDLITKPYKLDEINKIIQKALNLQKNI